VPVPRASAAEGAAKPGAPRCATGPLLQTARSRSARGPVPDPLRTRTALLSLVDRLEPTDNLGVVAFDDEATLVVPAGPLSDKAAVKAAIAAVRRGGRTDLSAGYLRGLQEARAESDRTTLRGPAQ
jgi:hypothetical protein